MRQLNKWQTIVFMLGGIGMVVGAGMFALQFAQQWACWIFLAGALAFAAMQWLQRYEGTDITIRRLRRMQVLAGVFFVLTGVLMVDFVHNFMRPWFSNLETYIQYVYNKWVLTLLIAVVLEVYSMHRLSKELSRE
ncbi:MAG: hypothetical protein IKX22_04035 [Prevotella sp.]|nr:hypothetical protein [Prevotella sp.]